jgi:hypothetical protein
MTRVKVTVDTMQLILFAFVACIVKMGISTFFGELWRKDILVTCYA